MSHRTILWYDYETSGRDPSGDRPLQFAAIRTDEALQEVERPVAARARLGDDVLPDPEACLVTGVVPGEHAAEELSELDFARVVNEAMARPGTCVAGFNSIRFDDEFTRFLFWRCLLPVYDREWRHGNSRWDLIDAMRAAYALRPEGIEWPRRDDGLPSFRLGDLAAANGIAAAAAHDALADVRMTIALARLLRARQPQLYAHLYRNRSKRAALALLTEAIDSGAPLVHTSRRFGAEVACTSVVAPVAVRREVGNQVVAVDLRHDPAVLLDLPPDRLRELCYTRRAELPADAPRVPLKTIHANRAPVLAPLQRLDAGCWDRIGLDRAVVEARLQWVRARRDELGPLLDHLAGRERDGDPDPDAALYDGFVPGPDQSRCREVHRQPPASWRALEPQFADARLRELLFRLRCREAPETLDDGERRRWREHLRLRLQTPLDAAVCRVDAVRSALQQLRRERASDQAALAVLDRVAALVDRRTAALAAQDAS